MASRLAEEAFKFLQEELDRLEKGINTSASASSSSYSLWRSYEKSWNRTAREHRHYEQQFQQSYYGNEQYESNDGSSSRRRSGGGGGGGGFFGGYATPIDLAEGKRWVKQAVVDLRALEALLCETQRDKELPSHVCFMAHEVAEKALKGGMYVTCGLGQKSLKSHNIVPLAYGIEAVRPAVAVGLAKLTSPLEPYYLDTRFPNRCDPPDIPSKYSSLSDAERAAKCARGILKIIRNIVQV